MNLSRWGWSPYETSEDMALEAAALSDLLQVAPECADAEIIVVHSKIPFGEEQLCRAPKLQLLITTTSGTDHIDLPRMRSAGITVCRLPLARRDAVVDATLGMLIWGMRRLGSLHRRAEEGAWARAELPQLGPIGLAESRIGVIGHGVIGARVSAVLRTLGAEVWGCDPAGLPDGVVSASVDEMLGHCDAVTLHCDLNSSTRDMISRARIESAQPGLVLVNTARGGLLDVSAAVEALGRGRLGGLALDVFPEEPYASMDMVRAHPDLMCLPHAAGYHVRLSEGIREGICGAVRALIAGSPVPYRLD